MGSRWCAWSLAAVTLLGSRAAFAEDIGREPLAPAERPAPEVVGPAQSPAAPMGGAAPATRVPAEADRSPAGGEGPRRHWYGWQTLLVDAIPAVGLLGVAESNASSRSDSVVIPLVTTYFLGGPVVHAAHGQVGKAFLSLGIRSVGPLFIALATTGDHSGEGPSVPLVIFGVLAIPAAIAIDSAAVAREDVSGEDASVLRRIAAAPWVDPKKGAGGVSMAVSF